MSDQSQQILKSMLNKFVPDGLFSLSEASQKLRVKEDYLLKMIEAGKLKGFRIGEYWFLEEKWLESFKALIHSNLEAESLNHQSIAERHKKWSRPVAIKRHANKKINVRSLSSATWSFSFYSLVLAFAVVGVSFTSTAFWGVYQQRQYLGVVLLTAVDNFYSAPMHIGKELVIDKIDDERLTGALASFLHLPLEGRVAGVAESRR